MDTPAIALWGLIKPITTEVLFQGTLYTLTFRIPTTDDDALILQRLKAYPDGESVLMEGVIRMAIALQSVNGEAVSSVHPSLDGRIHWIRHEWPDALLDRVLEAYNLALDLPFAKLREMVSDPNIVGRLIGNGEESATTSVPESN